MSTPRPDIRQPMSALPQDTLVRQRQASAPEGSAWVSANAGSGKTHVLAQRVVRLLLSGVPPARILCLTFTKAAAANMSIRVFRDLAAWTMLDDAALAKAIAETGAPVPAAQNLDLARQLFARTVETPGGLKIQTIHAFCERLLHLFPFEANVPARFEVIEELDGAELMARARAAGLAEALHQAGSPAAQALAILSNETTSATFDTLLGEALGRRGAVRAALRAGRTLADVAVRLRQVLGLGADETPDRIERRMIGDGLPAEQWGEIARRIGADGGGPGKTGNRLADAAVAVPGRRCGAYLDVYLTQKLEPRADTYLPAGLRRAEPALCGLLDQERSRIARLVERLHAARAVERTAALMVVAGLILDHYETAKRRRGLLDFDDLVERTRTLLKRSDAAWVLYKLDRGIDHILIDEAQDTSPAQWEILQAISADFFAGNGRPGARRTFFAVGDEKQSIYSFQGARPDMFAAMKMHFARRAGEAEQDFADIRLLLSFRSAAAVLDAVDRVFRVPANATGLTTDRDGPPPHQALKTLAGLVEIWPIVTSAPVEEPRDWRLPVDVADPHEPAVVLARRIAQAISRWIAPGSGEMVEDSHTRRTRPLRPGDVMILVRSRSAIFDALIRALKERRVPVAGADRLALTDHIAVMDLVAAGRAALLPEDDYTLACVLKSPLIGLDDDDLIRLAPGRRASLLQALEGSAEDRHRRAARRLEAWRRRAVTLTPFGFYIRLLAADGGRRALLERLGPEAGDAVDEFLSLTLAHERQGAPSLITFLGRLDGADLSIKRDMEAAGDAVRVMTVHAAKGLEAKVVILPDTCAVPNGRHDPKLFGIDETDADTGPLLWSPRQCDDPSAVTAARERARRRAMEEHQRLFYVAMTRAEERLYVAGFCGDTAPPQGCWYRMIDEAGLELAEAPAFWDAEARVRRRRDGPGSSEPVAELPAMTDPAPVERPRWLTKPPVIEDAAAPPIRPSNPLGAADQFAPVVWSFGDRHRSDRREALAAGRVMHKLLQHLPGVDAARRRQAGSRFLAAQAGKLEPERQSQLLERALAVIEDPRLGDVFGPASQAEVSVAARVRLPCGRDVDIAGQIDRIGVTADAVHIADYKTGRPGDEADIAHLLQLALYRAAIGPLYADRPIRAYLVWTAEPRIVEIGADLLDAALQAFVPAGAASRRDER